MARLETRLVEWASASRPFAPGDESGDACLVLELPRVELVAVVDGLGHGREAAAVAKRSLALIAGATGGSPLDMIRHCHEGLKETRGAVFGLAWFAKESSTMSWAGVGNVQGVLIRAASEANPRQVSLVFQSGVLGRQLPALHVSTMALAPGDTLTFATDGIAPGFADALGIEASPRRTADRILAEHWGGGDDALVVVGRYRGGAA